MNDVVSPSKNEVLSQLERILESKDFKNSARLSDFLKYIVARALDGEADQIKGYTIGVEALGKDANFDPDADASVRVEASRLRKALTLYYHEAGCNDSVVIRVPKGRYRPHFFYMKAPSSLPHKDRLAKGCHGFWWPLLLVLVLVLAALVLSISSFIHGPSEKGVMKTAPFSPVVMILPFKTIGGKGVQGFSEHFVLSLTDKLTAFDSVNAVSVGSVVGYEDWNKEGGELGNEIAAQYVIEGTVRENFYEIAIAIKLLDVSNDTYVWSYEKAYDVSNTSIDEIENRLTDFIAGRLGSPYGIIHSFEPSRMKNEKGRAAEAYRCVLSVYQYANNQSPEKHAEVRTCLEESVKRFPEYVEAWSLLSYLYIEEVTLDYNPKGFGMPAEQRAMKAAQRAVEIDPRSARAHQNMAEVAKVYGDEALLRRHVKAAILLNPNDSEVLANAAWSYGELGEWDKAQMYAEKAVLLNLGHPRWYHGILYSYDYEKGRYKEALMHALKYFQEDYLYSNIALITSYSALQKFDDARKVLDGAYERFPDFKESPKAAVNELHFQKDFREKLLVGLRAAGVNVE